jgi:hypothetical protein
MAFWKSLIAHPIVIACLSSRSVLEYAMTTESAHTNFVCASNSPSILLPACTLSDRYFQSLTLAFLKSLLIFNYQSVLFGLAKEDAGTPRSLQDRHCPKKCGPQIQLQRCYVAEDHCTEQFASFTISRSEHSRCSRICICV